MFKLRGEIMWIVLFRLSELPNVVAPSCWRLFPTQDEARAYAATILAMHPTGQYRIMRDLRETRVRAS